MCRLVVWFSLVAVSCLARVSRMGGPGLGEAGAHRARGRAGRLGLQEAKVHNIKLPPSEYTFSNGSYVSSARYESKVGH